MGIRRIINKYKLREKLPGFLTLTACIGTIATGILSAKAMYDYMHENKAKKGEIDLETAIKCAVLPTVVGAGTIASFIFARRADKATIAALSMAAAKAMDGAKKIPKEVVEKKAVDKIETPKDCCVVDEDGEYYYEQNSDILIKAKPSTIQEGNYKLNRNYQIRGIASLYEHLRLIGVKKADILDRKAEWTEVVGWNSARMDDQGLCWIDIFIEDTFRPGVHIIHYQEYPMPIAYDVGREVMDRCCCDEDDLLGYDLDRAENISNYISRTIHDNAVE